MLSRDLDATFWLSVLFLALGCGGKLDGDDGTRDDGVQAPTDAVPPKAGSNPSGTTALPECEPGFNPVREPGRRCDWMADDLCYGDKLAACACACPSNSSNTVCTSGFPQENGRVPVSCF